MDFKELEKMKVDQLRAEAAKLEGVEGVNAMKKQELIDLLCDKLDIQRPQAQSEEKAEVKSADTESEDKAEAASEAEAKPVAPPAAAEPAEAAKDAQKEAKVAEKKPSPHKGRLKALQAKRRQALADRDYQTLADVRMRIKRYKRKMKRESTAASTAS
ncbi:MAG TPA: Rho termination factor N-terminal domain-containing protein [Vicinamibacteria bacterium]